MTNQSQAAGRKPSNRSESPLKVVAVKEVITQAVALEATRRFGPNGPISLTDAFRQVAAQHVNGLPEAEAKRLLIEELAYVGLLEWKASERNRKHP